MNDILIKHIGKTGFHFLSEEFKNKIQKAVNEMVKKELEDESKRDWIDVKTKLPDSFELVLCANAEKKRVYTGKYSPTNKYWISSKSEYAVVNPTHWKPLDKYPEIKNDE